MKKETPKKEEKKEEPMAMEKNDRVPKLKEARVIKSAPKKPAKKKDSAVDDLIDRRRQQASFETSTRVGRASPTFSKGRAPSPRKSTTFRPRPGANM